MNLLIPTKGLWKTAVITIFTSSLLTACNDSSSDIEDKDSKIDAAYSVSEYIFPANTLAIGDGTKTVTATDFICQDADSKKVEKSFCGAVDLSKQTKIYQSPAGIKTQNEATYTYS